MLCVFVLAFLLPLIWADCPPGTIYESSFNKCYKFVNQPTGFLAAEQTCQGLGGHLVALRNGFETSFVSGVVLGGASNIKSFWIGANYLIISSWSWTYNVSFSYSNWASGQPADPSMYQCGAVRSSDNYWTKELCNSQKPFVCSIDPNVVPAGSPTCPPTPTCTSVSTTCPPEPTGNLTCPGRCPANYTQSPIDCKCYHWYQEANYLSFNDSRTFCESQNGSLIKITSAAQNSWLTNWLVHQGVGKPGVYYPWTGLTCPGLTKDACYWIDGSPLTCYDNFDTIYPSQQVWNGLNPNLFLRFDTWIPPNDLGTWLRCDPTFADCHLSVVCMRGMCLTSGCWIGLKRLCSASYDNTCWAWTDGTDGNMFPYYNWRPSQPDNAGLIENCGQINWVGAGTTDGSWDAIACVGGFATQIPYICKKPA